MSNVSISKWKSVQHNLNALPKVFQYEKNGVILKVETYRLAQATLASILDINSSRPNNQIRLNLIADASFDLNGSPGNAPAFNIVVGAYWADPTDHSTGNMNIPAWVDLLPNSQPMQWMDVDQKQFLHGRTISSTDAAIMEAEWADYPTPGIESDFIMYAPNADVVKGFTIGVQDTANIVSLLNDGSGADYEMFVHLGRLPDQYPKPGGDPFRFRPVIQLGPTLDHFYEFSAPCPPACRRLTVNPMHNPFPQ